MAQAEETKRPRCGGPSTELIALPSVIRGASSSVQYPGLAENDAIGDPHDLRAAAEGENDDAIGRTAGGAGHAGNSPRAPLGVAQARGRGTSVIGEDMSLEARDL